MRQNQSVCPQRASPSESTLPLSFCSVSSGKGLPPAATQKLVPEPQVSGVAEALVSEEKGLE